MTDVDRAAAPDAVRRGAFLATALGAAPSLVLVASSLSARRAGPLGAAAVLAALFAAGGAAGGVVYGATTRLRAAGGWGRGALSWCLSAYAALGFLAVGAHALLSLGWRDAAGLDRETAALVTGGRATVFLVASATLFGMLMAEATSTDECPRLYVRLHDPVRRGSLLAWGAAALVGTVSFGFLARDTALPDPETRADAQRVLAAARAEARLRPHDAHVQLVLGRALMELGRFDEALPVLEGAERLAPRDADPRNAVGWMLNQQRRFGDAVPHLREAVRLDPDYGHAQHNLGWALAHVGKLPEAEVAYRNAVRLKPTDAGAAYEFSMVLYERDKVPAALVQAQRAAQLAPGNPQYHGAAGWLLRSQARFPEAKGEFERATRLDPSNAGAWAELGVTDYLMHDAAGAAASFDEAARRDSLFLAMRPMEQQMWRAAKRGSTPPITIEWRSPGAVSHAVGH